MADKLKRKESGITLIAENCEVVGDIHFTDQLMINGVVRGNVIAQKGGKAKVHLSEKGRVKGEIRVPNVIINGSVEGDIHSDKHIELSARARISGNVYYNLIEMVMGSRLDGNLVHLSEVEAARVRREEQAREQLPSPAARETQREQQVAKERQLAKEKQAQAKVATVQERKTG